HCLPIVATGHLTAVGASASESVREIYVGALQAFPTSAFPPADYIALGHIHRPQKVGGHEHIRYSGSPIALSFDEAGQDKQVLLVDLDANGLQRVEPLPVACFQPLRSLRGDLQSLPERIREAAREGSEQRPAWLEVVVEADDYLSDLQARITALCEGLPVELLRLRRARQAQSAALPAGLAASLDELTPLEVFERRLAEETLPPERVQALLERHAQVLYAVQQEATENS